MGAAAVPIITAVIGAVSSAVVAHQNRPDAPVIPGASKGQQTNNAAQAAAAQLAKRRGMASTMLTGPQGILGAPAVQRATLGA